ncbi:MAG: type I DNA topoisomerase [Candidatus Dasytiphilus stammeri]
MGKALVIVESPAKAKTINKYLGSQYIVKYSIGHIRDLPTRCILKPTTIKSQIKPDENRALIIRMGIDPWHGWQANYQILPMKIKVVSELQCIARQAEHIFLATDRDREGEAIAWHLREVIGGDDSRFSRIILTELTQSAISKAFENPVKINIYRVHAQQTRRFLDRVVGYMVSPLLWKNISQGLSAGRVQSVAVKIIVKREREIKAFIPEEFWEIYADLMTAKGEILSMKVIHQAGRPLILSRREQSDQTLRLLEKSRYIVTDQKIKSTNSNPGAPFITSTLQQAACIQLGFSVKKTMLMAQYLYESGYITYMRTDSPKLSPESVDMVRNYIASHFGDKYLPAIPNVYTIQYISQEAHEAIRPSDITIEQPQDEVDEDAKRLYQIIRRQFMACQMVPLQSDVTILTVETDVFTLRAKGRIVIFDGWTRIFPNRWKFHKDLLLPPVSNGEILNLQQLLLQQHFTKPPFRYTEASLVQELEKRGIGRPSTYASIISTIKDRGYIRVYNRRFYAEKIGEIVTDRLTETFQEIISEDFTAKMEERLDRIANNQVEWKDVLNDFFYHFSEKLQQAKQDPEKGGMRLTQVVFTSINCPSCGRAMGIRTASTGVFLGCTGYNLKPTRCKRTINLIPELDVINKDSDKAKLRCIKCETAMDSYFIDHTKKFYVCGNNPRCDGYEIQEGQFTNKFLLMKCDKCDSDMFLKFGRFGKYMSCNNKQCKNKRNFLLNGELVPEPIPLPELLCKNSAAYFVLREGLSGIFLAAHTFPKSREVRAPLVEELKIFRERLPEKYDYLADAPLTDEKGNKCVICFSRKTKQHFVLSEQEGKATGWTAYFIDGKWQHFNKKPD